MEGIFWQWLGLQPYGPMLARQREAHDRMVAEKRSSGNAGQETVWMLEHTPVITLGKHADDHNLLIDENSLRRRGIDVFRIERGGDVTYHGPGQLVVYPLIDLERHHIGVKAYINILEECVIRTIGEFGIKGERIEGASGVWIGKGTDSERKICAVGVKCSRFVTMHGLALNVTTDLDAFSLINPCGFTDKGVTSIARETTTGHAPDVRQTALILQKHLAELLG